MTVLEARALHLRRGRARVLDDVSLRVGRAEVLGLVGPNGSGKSTLLRALAGLARADAGQVLLDGRDIARMPRRAVARRLAFVAQFADTADRLTVAGAAGLGRIPWLDRDNPWGPADDARVADGLARVGLAGMEDRDWASLSGGERQRVHIARALVQAPQILLLDEPTNHLDIRHQLQLLDLVTGLGIAVVIALHDLNHALRCDRVAVMQAGRLVQAGPPDRVLEPALLGRVFGIRAHRLTDPADGQAVWRFQP